MGPIEIRITVASLTDAVRLQRLLERASVDCADGLADQAAGAIKACIDQQERVRAGRPLLPQPAPGSGLAALDANIERARR